jgi:DNA-directed RNA polymerase subunit RPC12/RpoP
MATIAISCPKCESQINVPPELEGKKIRCKECSYVFVVKVPPGAKAAVKAEKPAKGKEAAPAAAQADDDEDANPYKMTDQSMLPRCAYCAKEMESEEQVVCLHCGYNHRTRERIQTEKTYNPTGGEWFVHLLPGILCAIVVLLAILTIVDCFLFRAEKEAAWEEATVNIYRLGLAIWRAVIAAFIGFVAARFAVKRLILHPRPVERKMAVKKKK